VKFTINDGSIGYKYNGAKETDVLWAFFNDGKNASIVNYSIKDGIVSDGETFRASTPVAPVYFNTCFVVFSDNRKSLEFCNGNGLVAPVSCIPFNKVK